MLNALLKNIGMASMQQTWLGDKNLAIFCIIAMSQWQFTGYITLLMVVAFQNVPNDYVEAAIIDGAGPVRRALSIILPLAKEQLLVCTIITVIGAFKLFTEVYSTTVGGPGNSSQVLGLFLYQNAFLHDDMGMAAATGVLIFVITVTASIFQLEGQPFRRSVRRDRMSTEKYVLRARILKILLHIFLLILVGIILFPVCWLVLNSLKTNQEMFLDSLALPKEWMFVNYATAWGKGLVAYFANSIIVGVLSIGTILALSSMLAYGLARFNLPGSGFIFILVLGGMALSEQVALVPLYKILQAVKLYNTRAALVLPYVAFRIPFTMFLMRSYFISIPKELEEAAIVDGCKSWQRFTKIILPISKPVLASCAIVNLNHVWNEFLFANVFLENKKLMTIPLGLMTFQGDLKSDYVVMLAGILICSLPMVILFLCMSRQFVRGLTSGAVKG